MSDVLVAFLAVLVSSFLFVVLSVADLPPSPFFFFNGLPANRRLESLRPTMGRGLTSVRCSIAQRMKDDSARRQHTTRSKWPPWMLSKAEKKISFCCLASAPTSDWVGRWVCRLLLLLLLLMRLLLVLLLLALLLLLLLLHDVFPLGRLFRSPH